MIALTAHAMASERQQLLNSGLDDYLTKPLNEKHLTHLLERWTSQTRQAVPRTEQEHPDFSADSDHLDPQLALSRCAGKADLVADMHTRLFDQLPDDAEDLRQLEIGGNRKQLLEHVHRLHGATRYCGTPRLEALAGKLETLLKSDASDDDIRLALSALIEEMQLLSSQDSLSIITKASA